MVILAQIALLENSVYVIAVRLVRAGEIFFD